MNVPLTVAALLADPHWFAKPEWVIVWVTSIYTVVSFLALIATYEDVFGDSHYTRFCQQIYWSGDDGKIIRGFYVPGRNEAT